MPLQETSGNISADAYGGSGAATVANYIEDVFSTYLYTGNSTGQTITNGIDLSTKGGMTWLKCRNTANTYNLLFDTLRPQEYGLSSDLTNGQINWTGFGINQWNTNGFSVQGNSQISNNSSCTYTSWTFRKQPKFFDVVTYTGNGANRTIAHNLGSTPGCIIVKRTDTSGDWQVYHRGFSNPSTQYGILNSYIGTPTSSSTIWNSTAPTSTVFSVGTNATVNASGGTYVAYLFAHDAGGFGASGTDNVISCGNFTTNSSGNATVDIGYEPQWLLIKDLANNQYWTIANNMCGITAAPATVTSATSLYASTAGAEGYAPYAITATGFTINQYTNTNYIYIAIRRGPMKTPTTGTSVFLPSTSTGVISSGFVVDSDWPIVRAGAAYSPSIYDRLRYDNYLITSSTSAETSGTNIGFDTNSGVTYSWPAGRVNYMFRRAPGFFDEVCYTGTGSNLTKNHNLGVKPELMIMKNRSGTPSGSDANWHVFYNFTTPLLFDRMYMNTTASAVNTDVYSGAGLSADPTSTTFSVDSKVGINTYNYVAYLFASCPGVSKVGSYTGNGSSQTINCGFTGGARFVMIKRTNSTGDWYVWDTARGMVAGNDPHLSLNTTAAEVTTDDSVDTDNSGFIVNQLTATNVNVSSATYIYLAIA